MGQRLGGVKAAPPAQHKAVSALPACLNRCPACLLQAEQAATPPTAGKRTRSSSIQQDDIAEQLRLRNSNQVGRCGRSVLQCPAWHDDWAGGGGRAAAASSSTPLLHCLACCCRLAPMC